jgi:hypothetical protein
MDVRGGVSVGHPIATCVEASVNVRRFISLCKDAECCRVVSDRIQDFVAQRETTGGIRCGEDAGVQRCITRCGTHIEGERADDLNEMSMIWLALWRRRLKGWREQPIRSMYLERAAKDMGSAPPIDHPRTCVGPGTETTSAILSNGSESCLRRSD